MIYRFWNGDDCWLFYKLFKKTKIHFSPCIFMLFWTLDRFLLLGKNESQFGKLLLWKKVVTQFFYLKIKSLHSCNRLGLKKVQGNRNRSCNRVSDIFTITCLQLGPKNKNFKIFFVSMIEIGSMRLISILIKTVTLFIRNKINYQLCFSNAKKNYKKIMKFDRDNLI